MMFRWITARGYRVTVALAVLVAAYHVVNELRVLIGGPPNLWQRLELTALDGKLGFRGERIPEPWRVAVAAIDEASIQRFGPLPWDRTLHARLVDRLTELGAGAIAFDMTFDRPAPTSIARGVLLIEGEFRQAGLDRAADRLRKTAGQLRGIARAKKGRGRRGRRQSAKLKRSAQDVRKVADGLARFESALTSGRAAAVDPDEAFARAIRDSGRVVLGVVAYSAQEAEALALRGGAEGAPALARVRTSTLTRLSIDQGDGLTRVVDAQDAFSSAFYHRYFGLQAPTAALAEATAHFGTINAVPDVDGVNRRMPLVSAVNAGGVLLPSLALKAAEVTLQAGDIEVVGDPQAAAPDVIRVGPLAITPELGATTTLDWPGRFDPDHFPIVSVVDLLDGKVAPERVRGRAVFVAATAIGTHDQRVTPLEPAVPGVYIHATLAQNVLEGRQLSRPAYVVFLEVLVLLLIGVITGPIMTRFRLWGQVGVAFALAVGWLVLNQLLFIQGLVVVTVLPAVLVFACLLAMSMWSYLVEQRERRQTRRAFAQYLSPGVLERVLAEPEEYLKLGGRRYDATVLFSDIRGFTTISEALTPEALGTMVNEYMTPMTRIVFRHQGTLDKYIGDAVMAFWGAPVEQPDHPVLACRAALEMQAEVERLNQRFAERSLPTISIGIGLSTGPMTIGNMGSDDHFAYTALGDRVNLGARLEGQTKEFGVSIMVSDTTYKRVEDEMRCRELGSIRVKGRTEPVRVYELLGPIDETEDLRPFVETFHRGLTLFQARKWDDAMGQFTRARALRGSAGDRASDLYIQWSMEYKDMPPPEDWDGVHAALTK